MDRQLQGDRGSKYWRALEGAKDLRDYYTHIDAMNSRALASSDVFEFLETVMLGIIWPSVQVKRTLQLGIFDLYWDVGPTARACTDHPAGRSYRATVFP